MTRRTTTPVTVMPSLVTIARNTSPPMPRMLKMPSVTIAPPISAPRSVPRNVTTGIAELRSRCTPTTRRGVRPFATAVRT